MIRQAIATALFYLNADERREGDCYWNNTYEIVTAPMVRSTPSLIPTEGGALDIGSVQSDLLSTPTPDAVTAADSGFPIKLPFGEETIH